METASSCFSPPSSNQFEFKANNNDVTPAINLSSYPIPSGFPESGSEQFSNVQTISQMANKRDYSGSGQAIMPSSLTWGKIGFTSADSFLHDPSRTDDATRLGHFNSLQKKIGEINACSQAAKNVAINYSNVNDKFRSDDILCNSITRNCDDYNNANACTVSQTEQSTGDCIKEHLFSNDKAEVGEPALVQHQSDNQIGANQNQPDIFNNFRAHHNLGSDIINYPESDYHNNNLESWRSIESPHDLQAHLNFNPVSIEESFSSTSIKAQTIPKDLGDINCLDFKEMSIELDVQNQPAGNEFQDIHVQNSQVSLYEVSKLLQNNSDLAVPDDSGRFSSNLFDTPWFQTSFNNQQSIFNYISGLYLDNDRYSFVGPQSAVENAFISSDLTNPIYDTGVQTDQLISHMQSNFPSDGKHFNFQNTTMDKGVSNSIPAPLGFSRDSYPKQSADEGTFAKADYQQETYQATSFLSSLSCRDEKHLEENSPKVYHSLETPQQNRINAHSNAFVPIRDELNAFNISGRKSSETTMGDSSQFSESFLDSPCDKQLYNGAYDFASEYYYKDLLNENQNDFLRNRNRGKRLKKSRQKTGRLTGKSSSRTDQLSYDYRLTREPNDYSSNYSNVLRNTTMDGYGDNARVTWNEKGNVGLGHNGQYNENVNYASKTNPSVKHTNQFVFDTSKRPSNVNEAICKYMDYLILENECKTCISSCSTGVQLPFVGFEKERYFHEVMCQPISFPTAKFRDWLKLFDMDIEITDVDGLTASQTTFLPPLSQNNFAPPLLSLDEEKINVNGLSGKPKDDLILQPSRRSEMAIRSRGRPRKSWSGFSRYSDKDKSTYLDTSHSSQDILPIFSIPKQRWSLNKEQFAVKNSIINLSSLSNSAPFQSAQLILSNSQNQGPTGTSFNVSGLEQKTVSKPQFQVQNSSIKVLKKGNNESVVIKMVSPPKVQYRLSFEKLNSIKTEKDQTSDVSIKTKVTELGTSLKLLQCPTNKDSSICPTSKEMPTETPKDDRKVVKIIPDSKKSDNGARSEKPSNTKTCFGNLFLSCEPTNENVPHRVSITDPVKQPYSISEKSLLVAGGLKRKGIKISGRDCNISGRDCNAEEQLTAEENISQSLDVGSNLEIQAEDTPESPGHLCSKKRGRPRSSLSIISPTSQTILRKMKTIEVRSHEVTTKIIKLDM